MWFQTPHHLAPTLPREEGSSLGVSKVSPRLSLPIYETAVAQTCLWGLWGEGDRLVLLNPGLLETLPQAGCYCYSCYYCYHSDTPHQTWGALYLQFFL